MPKNVESNFKREKEFEDVMFFQRDCREERRFMKTGSCAFVKKIRTDCGWH